MCGGKRSVFDQVRPILDALSVDLLYIGTAGQAAQVKALVNMVMNINTAGLAEGLGLGQALGLDLEMLMKVFSQTGANSRSWKPTARHDHPATTSAISPLTTRLKIPASPSNWRNRPDSAYRWRKRPRINTRK